MPDIVVQEWALKMAVDTKKQRLSDYVAILRDAREKARRGEKFSKKDVQIAERGIAFWKSVTPRGLIEIALGIQGKFVGPPK